MACGLHIAHRRGPSAVVYILVLWPLLTLEDRPSSMPYTAQPASDCKTFRTLCEPPSADVGSEHSSNIRMAGFIFLIPADRCHYYLSRSKIVNNPLSTPHSSTHPHQIPYNFATVLFSLVVCKLNGRCEWGCFRLHLHLGKHLNINVD